MGKIAKDKIQVGVIISREIRAEIKGIEKRDNVKLSEAIRYLVERGLEVDKKKNK